LLKFVYISLGFVKFKVLAPKRIHTRSHPDPEPAIAVDDPEKLLRKKNTVEGFGSHSPLHRSTSLPENLVAIQDLEFDISFEKSLFRTKSDSFISETVLDQTILQPRTPEILSPREEFDQRFLQEFNKLEDLVANLDQALYQAHFQQSVELSSLTIVAASIKHQIIHSTSPSPTSSTSSVTSPPITQVVVQPPPPIMAARYAPLVLVAPLHAMPQDYQTRLPQFDGTGPLNAQQHVDKMNDYFDLQEVDEADVQMRLFAQSLTGEVKKWFKSLCPATIVDIAAFQWSFLDRWEVKKNPLQILSEYENIKRNQGETVQDYCIRFNNIYNAIPTDIKPPQGLDLIKFPDGFDADMSYQLRERNYVTLEDMQKSAVSVEANLLARRARQRTERRVTIKEDPSMSSSDAKLDSIVRSMERMMERLTIADINPPRENQPAPQIRNPNFRRNPTQIRQRDLRDQREKRGPDQQIRPPLQENYTDDGEEIIEELDDTHINLMGVHDDDSIFLTQEEHELFLLSQTKVNEEEEETNNRPLRML
jgi:hypothetical protein